VPRTLAAIAPEQGVAVSAYAAVENIPALGRRDADWLADRIVDAAIDALRRDPKISRRSFAEWSLTLADLRLRIGELLNEQINGHVNLDEVLNTIELVGKWPMG